MFMKTNEVVQKLNITRETLRYYEQQNLIHPMKAENGYRNYDQADLEVLQLIISLRELDFSVLQIKEILNNEVSLYDCLIRKEREIFEFLSKKQDVLEKIQMNLYRRRMYCFYQTVPEEHEQEEVLLFKDEEISIQRTDKENIVTDVQSINYSDIDKIEVSLCTRHDIIHNKNRTLFHRTKLSEYVFVGAQFPIPTLPFYCHIDFTIYAKHQIWKFESRNNSQMSNIFKHLTKKDIEIIDPLGLLPLFERYDNKLYFMQHIERNLRKWTKKYHIDNPRIESVNKQLESIWKELKTIPNFWFTNTGQSAKHQ